MSWSSSRNILRVINDGEARSVQRVHPATYLFAARALRDFGDGFVAVLLPAYLALAAAVGALAAATPDVLVPAGLDQLTAIKMMFVLYAFLGIVGGLL